jgi:hypothetical protein
MKRELRKCDRCGVEFENAKVAWHAAIIAVEIICPPDSINGGRFSHDLCESCRTILNDYLVKFFDAAPISGKATGNIASNRRQS